MFPTKPASLNSLWEGSDNASNLTTSRIVRRTQTENEENIQLEVKQVSYITFMTRQTCFPFESKKNTEGKILNKAQQN
jgi:hypothetical protein